MKTQKIGALTLISILFTFSTAIAGYIVEDGLIGYWSFDKKTIKGKQVQDLSKKGQHGEIFGDLEIVEGKFGNALKFGGKTSQYVMIAGSMKKAKALPTRGITIEAWAIDEAFLEWGGYVGCVQDNGSFEKGWVLGTNNQVAFAVSTEKPNDGDGTLTYVKATKVAPDRGDWFHVAGTYDGDVVKIYINGELSGENKNHNGDLNYPKEGDSAPDAEFIIGKYKDVNEDFPHKGVIDEMKIYDRALSQKEIQQNMDGAGLAVDPASKLSATWGEIRSILTR